MPEIILDDRRQQSIPVAAFLETLKAGSTASVFAKVKPFTANTGGTITVNA